MKFYMLLLKGIRIDENEKKKKNKPLIDGVFGSGVIGRGVSILTGTGCGVSGLTSTGLGVFSIRIMKNKKKKNRRNFLRGAVGVKSINDFD
jgi:hypothetical protein